MGKGEGTKKKRVRISSTSQDRDCFIAVGLITRNVALVLIRPGSDLSLRWRHFPPSQLRGGGLRRALVVPQSPVIENWEDTGNVCQKTEGS